LLIAALNPCPCGYFGDNTKPCICSSVQIQKYQSKLSGPLLDRIDIKVSVQAVSYQDATETKTPDQISSAKLKEGIVCALARQKQRFGSIDKTNSMMSAQEVEQYCKADAEGQKLLETAFAKLNLSMRSYHKILKLARTIADIADSDRIESKHIQEAIMYKS
jgi:magnesium chelatase family protein